MPLRLRRCAEIIGVRVTFLANPQTSQPADARAGRESRFSAARACGNDARERRTGLYPECVDAGLISLLRGELAARFESQLPRFGGGGSRVATFNCASGSIGDLMVEADGAGVIVDVVEMTYGHFDPGFTGRDRRGLRAVLGGPLRQQGRRLGLVVRRWRRM